MSAFSFIKKENVDYGTEVAKAPSTTFADVVSSSFQSTKDNYLSSSESQVMGEITGDRDKRFKELTGRDIYSDALQFLDDSDSVRQPTTGLLKTSDKRLQEAADKVIARMRETGELVDDGLITSGEIRSQAIERAKKSLETSQKVEAGASSFSATAGSIVGGIGAGFLDPINLATIPLGAASSAGILRTALTEAAINVGSEVAIQPFVADWQNQVGNKYGFSEIAENIGMAAIFGGGIGGLSRGLSLGVEHAPEVFGRMKERFKALKNYEAMEAAEFMERKAHIDGSDISRVSEVDYDVHVKNMEEINAALANETKIKESNIRLSDADIQKMDLEKVDIGMKRTVREFQDPEINGKYDVDPEIEKTPVHEALDFSRPEVPDIQAQKQLEEIYNSDAVRIREETAFNDLVSSAESYTIFGDVDGQAMTLKDIADTVKADRDYLDIIRTCGV